MFVAGSPMDVRSPAPFGWSPWPEDEDFCCELMKLLSAAETGATEFYECLVLAARIDAGDREGWYREWKAAAQRSKARADLASSRGNLTTALASWRRASAYFRAAEAFIKFGDRRRKLMLDQMRECSLSYLQHVSPAGEVVKIETSDNRVIEGYFLPASRAVSPAPVVLCVGGPESLKDDALCRLRQYGLDRGLSLLLVDLIDPVTFEPRRMSRRNDAAVLMGCCIDHLIERDDVDEHKVAILGEGLGGALATQVVMEDCRLKAAVCDGGLTDLLQRSFSLQQFVNGSDGDALKHISEILGRHPIARRIRCPSLVVMNEDVFADTAVATSSLNIIGPNVVLRSVPHLEALASISPSTSSAIINEFVFDWIADQLNQTHGSKRLRNTSQLEFGG